MTVHGVGTKEGQALRYWDLTKHPEVGIPGDKLDARVHLFPWVKCEIITHRQRTAEVPLI